MDNTQEGSGRTQLTSEGPARLSPGQDSHLPETVSESALREETEDVEAVGEVPDTVADSTQEPGEDNTAQTAEEDDMARTEIQPDTPEKAAEEQVVAQTVPAGRDRVRVAVTTVPNHESQDSSPDSSDVTETAGETGDVVQDSTQETGDDQIAQSAEEQDIDIQASQQVDPGRSLDA